jgi:hypothetical protein
MLLIVSAGECISIKTVLSQKLACNVYHSADYDLALKGHYGCQHLYGPAIAY